MRPAVEYMLHTKRATWADLKWGIRATAHMPGDRLREAFAETGWVSLGRILDDAEVPTPIEDAVANMRVIEAVFRSSESGRFEAM